MLQCSIAVLFVRCNKSCCTAAFGLGGTARYLERARGGTESLGRVAEDRGLGIGVNRRLCGLVCTVLQETKGGRETADCNQRNGKAVLERGKPSLVPIR